MPVTRRRAREAAGGGDAGGTAQPPSKRAARGRAAAKAAKVAEPSAEPSAAPLAEPPAANALPAGAVAGAMAGAATQRAGAFLRGVNVAGARRLPMKELREELADAGFGTVQTYLQSGNIALDCGSRSPAATAEALAAAIEARWGYDDVHVDVRLAAEIRAIADGWPFEADPAANPTQALVAMLDAAPTAAAAAAWEKDLAALPESARVVGDLVYLHCPEGYGRSKVTNPILERKLGVKATTRNWNTIIAMRGLTAPL